jgi:hypothetical protein
VQKERTMGDADDNRTTPSFSSNTMPASYDRAEARKQQPQSDGAESERRWQDRPSLLAQLNELNALNAEYFVAPDGGRTLVVTFKKDRGREVATFFSFTDFRNLYMNRLVRIEAADEAKPDRYVRLGTWWLNHRNRRQYRGLVFEPGNSSQVVDGCFNLWRGWGVKPRRGDWSLMRAHIRLVLANSDPTRDEYIMRWLAWSVQNPNRPAEVALAMRGKRGTGKGTLANAMHRLFGQHSHHVSDPKHLIGNFNAHLRDTCFLYGDECFWPGDKSGEGALKRMLTEPTLFIEAKGRDAISVPNYLHVLISSNEDWVVPAGENERRFYLLDVPTIKIQDESWFGPIKDQMEKGGHEAMLYDLLHYDLGDWHPRRLPRNNEIASQQARSLGPLDSWWIELLETGTLAGCDPMGRPDRAISNGYDAVVRGSPGLRIVKKPGLYDQARVIEPRLRTHFNDHLLGGYLTAQGCDNKKKIMRKRGWSFPPLAECRKKWEGRFPGWPWRNPGLTEWQHEEEDD